MALASVPLGAPHPFAKWPDVEHVELPNSLDALLRQAADIYSDDLAWRFVDCAEHPAAELTYRSVDQYVDRYAAALAHAGVGAETHVAVMLPNVPEFPLIWLALGRLGAVVVPMNPAYTAREIDHVASKSRASFIITDRERVDGLMTARVVRDGLSGGVLLVTDDHGDNVPGAQRFDRLLAAAHHDEVPALSLPPDTLINIQFTSGTTGLPKGCMLTHRYWVQLGLVSSAIGGAPRRMLADHPFFYMQNQAYLASALWCGACLIVTRGLSRSRFLDLIEKHAIDFSWYIDVLDDPSAPAERARSLTFIPSAGVHADEHAAAEKRFGIVVRDHYASTEAGSALAVPVDRGDIMAQPGALGFPVPFRRSKVVDRNLNEVAPGTPGELCISGPGMMLGYFDEPAINAETFIGEWYRTGDQAVKRADGQHFYLGRIKDSISRSGENISAAEVEAVLQSIDVVEEAAVIGVPDDERGEEVKAYLVVRAGADQPGPERIFEACRQQLAPFKVPRFLEYLDELPLTAGSGKVSKGALRTAKPDLRAGSYDRLQQTWLPSHQH